MMHVSRRTLIVGGLAFFIPARALCQTGAWESIALAVGQMAAEWMVNDRLSDDAPSTQDVIDAISASIAQLGEELKQDMRKAIADNEVRTLRAKAESVGQNLDLFQKLKTEHRPIYRSLLDFALQATADGITLSQQHGLAALPTFSIFVSLRSFTVVALDKLDNSGLKSNYAQHLRSYGSWLRQQVVAYDASLDPEARLGKVECADLGAGKKYTSRPYVCQFKVDGKPGKPPGKFAAGNVNGNESTMRPIAQRLRAGRAAELEAFRVAQNRTLVRPMLMLADEWDKLADNLTS